MSRPPNATKLILFTDADNTLWDTDRIFAEAQLSLLRDVEKYLNMSPIRSRRLAFVRSLDQSLAQRHEAGLRYPPILLIQALLERRGASRPTSLTAKEKATMKEIERRFLYFVGNSIPRLRRGVRTGLAQLDMANVKIVIMTETSVERCRRTLEANNINQHVAAIHSGNKSPSSFVELDDSYPYHPKFFVGDQLDLDIALAHGCGFETIYFPSRFRPKWTKAIKNVADHTIHSFAEVPRIVDQYFQKQ